MRYQTKITSLAVAVLLCVLPQLVEGAGWFGAGGPSGHLDLAHEAFLNGDWTAMASEIRKLIQDPAAGDLEKGNALDLLKEAYASGRCQRVQVDWHLPASITRMKVQLNRYRRPDSEQFALKLAGNIERPGAIRQLRLTRYPDQVVLDKQAGLGEWTEEKERDGDIYYELYGQRTREPAGDGLYLLSIETADGQRTEGWFLLNDLVSTETPSVQVPAVGQKFSTATPTMSWEDFRSPQYHPSERRNLWTAVVRFEPPDYKWDLKWDYWEGDPSRASITVGEGKPVSLTAGRYLFYLDYAESRPFGDLVLSRASTAVVPFSVVGR